ncbi:MAG: hypothetical protein KDC46_10300 [Thermoleophilia bacterium]|nr:hypothetical protein [Thermoleophilia bacterium]
MAGLLIIAILVVGYFWDKHRWGVLFERDDDEVGRAVVEQRALDEFVNHGVDE